MDKIQKNLGTNYKYYDSPFLVFFRRNKIDGSFRAYEIISFSQSPLTCTKNYLSSIEQIIYNSKSNKETVDRLNKIQFATCNVIGNYYQEDPTKAFTNLVKLIVSWFG